MSRRGVVVSVIALLALAGCGSGQSSAGETKTVSPSAKPLGQAEIRQAEAAVKNELPKDVPIWKGTTFKGVIVNDRTVCVDRTFAKGGGIDGKGGNAGSVMVTFPGAKTGEPLDGTCAQEAAAAATSKPPAPVHVPANLKGKRGLVTRDDLGSKWPLKVDYAVLACTTKTVAGRQLQIATLKAPSGVVYALNGTAIGQHKYAKIDQIWANDPTTAGLKIDIGPLIDRALKLC